jgi:cell pole-organizing protein PopZ
MEEILASIRRIISEDSEPAKAPGPGQAAPRQAEADVLELTQVVADDGSAHKPEPVQERRGPSAAEKARAARSEPPPERPAPKRAAPQQPLRNETDLAMVDNDDRDNGLMSNQVHSAISQAFNMLSGNRDVPVSSGEARTLEDIVAQMLKPMLKDWLEQNLPETVERVVREEVERAARMSRRR